MCFAVANKQQFKKHKQNEIIHIITAMLHFSSLKINNFALLSLCLTECGLRNTFSSTVLIKWSWLHD